MSRFIRLTCYGEPVYCNVETISRITRVEGVPKYLDVQQARDKETIVSFVGVQTTFVDQSPEEIMKMINEVKEHVFDLSEHIQLGVPFPDELKTALRTTPDP